MDGVDYAFYISYTTIYQNGSLGDSGQFSNAGTYPLGHDADYFSWYGNYGALFYRGYVWYYTIPGYAGYDVYFFGSGHGTDYCEQSGYWNLVF